MGLKVKTALKLCKERLKGCKIETYESDCIFFIAHLIGVHPSLLPLEEEREFKHLKELGEFFKKRCEERIPVQHIIGEWDCLERTFKVFPKVLSPRGATELLVETAIGLIEETFGNTPILGLEVGTGTGCISVNLLCEFPNLKMVGVEIDPIAVKNTIHNAKLHGVEDRLTLLEGDIFELCPKGLQKFGKFHFLVSNPPYIAEEDLNKLPPEVKYENPVALNGGKGGTKFHKFFATHCDKILKEDGFMVLEFEPFQKGELEKFFTSKGWKVEFVEDFVGNPRILIAKKS